MSTWMITPSYKLPINLRHLRIYVCAQSELSDQTVYLLSHIRPYQVVCEYPRLVDALDGQERL